MSCSPFDLRDYFFGELPEEDRRQVDLHSRSCLTCREELNRLRSTQAALLAVADEEIPQRIGFISDRVYEPSRLRRWWGAFWESAPRLGFASAAMLSAAIIVSAMHRPAVVTPPAPAGAVDVVKLQADFSRQLNEAVQKAVAESDARHEQRTAQLLTAAARRFDGERKSDIEQVSQRFAILEKYYRREMRASILGGGPQ
jgi:anti-sigma factor RsiW